MSKYRVITNGECYRIQELYLTKYDDLWVEIGADGRPSGGKLNLSVTFEEYTDAKQFILNLRSQESWKVYKVCMK